ncbi:MAG: sodium:calcium antiporter, partial [Candidatus Latescibacteria bacterium]|nr:sodium:calcium antiporter [Candidatus Latescibacterota bacterium]
IVMVILGTAGLGLGGMIFVKGARDIAYTLGVSESVIGLTVVALGTSLPELITSSIAALKGHSDISLGNIVGSNIFNILLVIGSTASIRPYDIPYDRFMNNVGMPFMMGLAVLLMIFSIFKNRLAKPEGALFFIFYVVYCVLAVIMAK